MVEYLMIKDDCNPDSLTEINDKAYIRTDTGTCKIRESMHSNTFLIKIGESYKQIKKIYELSPIDLKSLKIEECRISSITMLDLTDSLRDEEIEELIRSEHLLSRGKSVAKIAAVDIIKILCYMQSLESKEDFSIHTKEIKDWATRHFSGSSEELGFYVLLDAMRRGRQEDFIDEWRKVDLFNPCIESLREYVTKSEHSSKEAVLGFLNKKISK